MTAASLRSTTCKELGQIAKQEGVPGWHSMRKDELIKALLNVARRKSRVPKTKKLAARNSAAANGRATNGHATNRHATSARKATNPRVASKIRKFQSARQIMKLLTPNGQNGHATAEPETDRLVAMVRGPFWLHASWELRRKSVERAAAAMGQLWHSARPVLRLLSVSSNGTTNTAQQVLRDIDIHGGVNHWYVDVGDPPSSFQLDIGYLADNGQYFSLARSNIVTTPIPSACSELDENWQEVAQSCDKIFAMSGGVDGNGSVVELKELFEERLRRPMGAPIVTRYGIAVEGTGLDESNLEFDVEAEMIVYGTASPRAHVTFRGEPIELRDDGTFTIRMGLPDRRQVIPIVATRPDGVEQRTVVLAIERNTKIMETLVRDPEAPA
jgi:hypothetical protein